MSQKLEKFHKYLNLYQKLIKKNAGQFVDGQLAEDVAQETFIKMYEPDVENDGTNDSVLGRRGIIGLAPSAKEA